MVLEDVPRETIMAALTVNSVWYSAALPLLYTHLYFDPNGPKPGVIRTEHLSRVKVLDIYNHGMCDCAGMDFKKSLQVIRMHFRFTLGLMVGGHGGKPCPLFDLKPETVVYLDFDGRRTVQRDYRTFPSIVLYPDAKERVLVWDISSGLNPYGFSGQSDVIFPSPPGRWGITEMIEELEAGNTSLKAELPDLSEIVIFSNKRCLPIDDYPQLWEFFDEWLFPATALKHVVVNFEAFDPGYPASVNYLRDELRGYCHDHGQLFPRRPNGTAKYTKLLPLNYTTWHEIPEYRDHMAKFLTRKEIKALLPRNRRALRAAYTPDSFEDRNQERNPCGSLAAVGCGCGW